MRRVYLVLAFLVAVLALPARASAQTYYGHYREIRYLDSTGEEVGARIRLCNGQTVVSGTVTGNAVDSGMQHCPPIYQSEPITTHDTVWYWECTLGNGTDGNQDGTIDLYQCGIKLW